MLIQSCGEKKSLEGTKVKLWQILKYYFFMFFQEALSGRCWTRQRPIAWYQSEIIVSPQDESLASKTTVPIAAPPLPLFPPQTEQVSTETEVMAAHFSLNLSTCDRRHYPKSQQSSSQKSLENSCVSLISFWWFNSCLDMNSVYIPVC